ncbi:uncharacterized protein LOC114245628 [Bombyx mandarina]|uniref:Uncharacterized protein LOC114245628 n=1 Tax=Bombyx mandarina TaxID=7092 RepID=A0A6J2K010_BOMMA|nr:uncharacterized protein LOC114245628 [Bombyx mandarina]
MSTKYHKNCTKDPNELEDPTRKQPDEQPTRKLKPLTTKPLCDCSNCTCKDCPDVLKTFSINVTEDSCDFGTKKVEQIDESSHEVSIKDCQSLLDVLNNTRNCTCEIIAKVVRSNVYIHRGKHKVSDILDDTNVANVSIKPEE